MRPLGDHFPSDWTTDVREAVKSAAQPHPRKQGGRTRNRGLTPRDRLDRILQLIAESIGPQLRADPRVADYPIQLKSQGVPLSRFPKKLDPPQCLEIIRDRQHVLFGGLASERACEHAQFLIDLRNHLVHNDKVIDVDDVHLASDRACFLLNLFGLTPEAQQAVELRLPPDIPYVAELRKILVAAARRHQPINYEEVLEKLGLIKTDKEFRKLFRQLNILAAPQMILGEPQLCALVVRADTETPGDGFWWVVDDLPLNATEKQKSAAHKKIIDEVHNWVR